MAKIINNERPKTYQSALDFYKDRLGKTELLTLEDEKRLGELKEEGELEARQKMIKSNTRLAFKIAKSFSYSYGLDPEEFEDLIQEANIGLIRGIDKFDPDRAKISTYVSWWIKQACQRALYTPGKVVGGEFKGTFRLMELKRQIKKSWYEFVRENNREPKRDELIVFASEYTGKSKAKVEYAFDFPDESVSLNAGIGEDDLFLIDFVENIESDRPENFVEQVKQGTKLRILDSKLGKLKGKEEDVLRLRYGISNERMRKEYGLNEGRLRNIRKEDKRTSLKDVGFFMGMSTESIRQIEKRAIEKLRYLLLKDPEYELFVSDSENPFARDFTDFERTGAGKVPKRAVATDKYNFWDVVGKEIEKFMGEREDEEIQIMSKRANLKLYDKMRKSEIGEMLGYLTEKQEELIRLTYGIGDESLRDEYGFGKTERITQSQIADVLGVTNATVAVRKKAAENKLLKIYKTEGVSSGKRVHSRKSTDKGAEATQKRRRERVGDYELARRVLSNLEPEDRAVVNILYQIDEEILQDNYGMNGQKPTYKLASELTGVPVGSIPYRAQRGLRELKKHMALVDSLDS